MRVTGSLRRQEENPEHQGEGLSLGRNGDFTSFIIENTTENKEERMTAGSGLVCRFNRKKEGHI